jgi:hypothetical protein
MENNGRGTKAIGMANAFTAISDNPWALSYNPAGLARISSIEFSAFLIPEQFGLPELRTTSFAVIFPFSFVTCGLKMEKFGFDLYSECEYSIGTAIPIKRDFSIGISLDYNRLNIANYGSANKLILNAGLIAWLSVDLSLGFSVHNITRASIGKNKDRIPQVINLGICWSFIETLNISLETEKDIRYPLSIKTGIEKILFDIIALRCGVANNPDKFSAGIAINYSHIEFSYAGYYHSDLGWTNQIELSFKFDE